MQRFPRRSWPAVVAIASVYAFVSFAAVQLVYDWELDRKGLHAHGFQPAKVFRNTFEIHLVGFLVWLAFAIATAFLVQRFQRQLADALASTHRRAIDLSHISDVGASMAAPISQDRLAAEFLDRIAWIEESAQGVSILMLDRDWPSMRVLASSGRWALPVHEFDVPAELPIVHARLLLGEAVTPDVTSGAGVPWVRELAGLLPWVQRAESLVVMPLMSRDRPIGALVLGSEAAAAFPAERVSLLRSLARYLAGALDGADLLERAETRANREQEINEELLRLDRAKNDFVSMVAHEFRTPLTGIQGFSEIIRDYDITTAEIREYANDINADARRLARMINAQLDLDRLNSGKLELRRESIDLNQLVRDLVDHLAGVSPEGEVTLTLTPGLRNVDGDRDRLIQVLSNLLSNAVKFSPSGGEIEVITRPHADGIELIVSDHGVGIPQTEIERIFQPYTRIESPDTGAVMGTGLGLPIVRQIVELHGGNVRVASEVGQGSRFHVVLPAIASEMSDGDDRRLRGRPDDSEALPDRAPVHAA